MDVTDNCSLSICFLLLLSVCSWQCQLQGIYVDMPGSLAIREFELGLWVKASEWDFLAYIEELEKFCEVHLTAFLIYIVDVDETISVI